MNSVSQEQIKRFILDKFILLPLAGGVILLLISFSLIYVDLIPFSENIIVHLNLQSEIDILADRADVVAMFVGFFAIFAVNYVLSFSLYYKERMLSYFVSFSTVWILLIATVIVYLLTKIN